jgi:hypothetical protein
MKEYQVTITMNTTDEEWTSTNISNEIIAWLGDLGFEIQTSRVTYMGDNIKEESNYEYKKE